MIHKKPTQIALGVEDLEDIIVRLRNQQTQQSPQTSSASSPEREALIQSIEQHQKKLDVEKRIGFVSSMSPIPTVKCLHFPVPAWLCLPWANFCPPTAVVGMISCIRAAGTNTPLDAEADRWLPYQGEANSESARVDLAHADARHGSPLGRDGEIATMTNSDRRPSGQDILPPNTTASSSASQLASTKIAILPVCPFPRLMELPDDVWLHLADADASLAMHCTLSAINHRLRGLMGLPPLRAIIGRCAGSLRFLSICVDERMLWLPPMPNLRTLFLMANMGAPMPILHQCPNLVVLGMPHFSTKVPVAFTRELEAITEVESADVDESVKVTIGGGDPTGAWAGHEEGRQSLFLPARVRRLALQCHPADVPALLGHLPNLTHLELIPSTSQTPDGMEAFMRSLAQACPRLAELHLGPNVALTTPEDLAEVGPVLVSLSGRLTITADPVVTMSLAKLRRCHLQLRTDLKAITLDLPQVQELSLSVPASLVGLSLRCPWLRSVSITIREPGSTAPAPQAPLCIDCQAHLPLSSIELRSPLAPDMRIYESCCAPLVAAVTGSVDVRRSCPNAETD
ncbi:hypothetical protein PAPYR_9729 [Paratrimastix pyriformis]|uniref:F-box domain-containing protein n=1 Tax=Paratrimastix pyriformis TaxID=342808 RepID=A0ABQ8U7P3_9EUKA|nr:hypothetical protein PAPYR_9729 [Paratrimastix pyriformis]